jgi:hypothetical protein
VRIVVNSNSLFSDPLGIELWGSNTLVIFVRVCQYVSSKFLPQFIQKAPNTIPFITF